MKKDRIGEFEQMVLLAVIRLGSRAYGMTIRQEIAERADRDVAIGAVYTTLERLEQKGFVKSRVGEATPERGGKAKRYYRITGQGENVLDQSWKTFTRLWDGWQPKKA